MRTTVFEDALISDNVKLRQRLAKVDEELIRVRTERDTFKRLWIAGQSLTHQKEQKEGR